MVHIVEIPAQRACDNRILTIMKNNIVRLLAALEVRPWLAPLSIGMLALLPRAALALYLPAKIIWYDGARYMRVADNLLQTGGFGSLRDNMLSVPAQPVLLAALRLLFGTNFTALRLCFAVLGAVTCVVCYLLARRLFGTATALLAAVALALYPPYIYVSALFEYPQTPYILVMGCSFLLLLRYFERGGLGAIGACGLLLGVAIETVPTTQLFIPLVVLCALFVKRWSALPGVIVLCLCLALPVGAWTVRNYLAYGDPIMVNRAGGWAFWTANNETYFRYGKQAVVPPCENGNQDYEFCHDWTQIRRDLHEREGLTTEQRVRLEDQANWEKGKQFLLASPGRAATLAVRKFLQFWSPIPDAISNRDESSGATTWISILSYLPVLVLGCMGLLRSRRHWRELLPVYAYFAMFTAVFSVFLPTTRYRLPLDFFLVIFATYALTRMVPWLRTLEPTSSQQPSSR
jgi:4-amino-4-deoxy-L-arabinose transferase-like glycosyltransferase